MKVFLDKGAIMPTKAHDTDAGWDLYTREDVKINGSISQSYFPSIDAPVIIGHTVINTGVHVSIPKGYVGMIKSKSGLNVKNGLIAEGVIDSGYTGPIMVKMYNLTGNDYTFNAGDKITQLVILPINTDTMEEVKSVEELGITERGDGRFGSTGK